MTMKVPSMTAIGVESSVHNSRPFDVHRWSEHPEVEGFVAPLWLRFNGQQADVSAVKKGRPTKRIKRDNMKVLLLDFYVCWCEDPTRYIGISSNINDWSKGRYKAIHLSPTILVVLDWLVAEGLVNKRNHFHSRNSSLSRTARYRASESLQSLFETALFGIDDIHAHDNKECIVLKQIEVIDSESAETSKSIDYEDTLQTAAMRQRLTAYNKLLNQSHVDIYSLAKPVIKREIKKGSRKGQLNTVAIGQHNKFVRRIFSRGSWELHGRFYGGWWQQIGNEDRRHIFINGNPTVEVDFKSMHVALISAELGADVIDDAYAVGAELFPKHTDEEVRAWCKSLVLTAINAKDRPSTYKAFRSDAKKGSPEKRLKNIQLEWLLNAFIAKSPHLEDYLCSDQGITLMHKDGMIAADIMNRLTDKGIPVLTVHDSFIVQRHHFSELRIAMVMATLKHCRRNLKANQKGLELEFEKTMNWGVINEQAVNKLPKYEPCEQYLYRLHRFCEARGLVQERSIAGRGLGARKVNVLKDKDVFTSKALELPPNEANDNHMPMRQYG
jgi:hypothetical protein